MSRGPQAVPSIDPGRDPPGRTGSAVATIAVVVIAIAALYVGRDIFIPFAIAALLCFALGPLISRLRRWGVGRIPAVLIVCTLAFLAISGFAVLVGSQVIQLANNLPSYQYNIRAKIQSVQSAGSDGGVIDRAAAVLHELSSELSPETPEADGAAGNSKSAVRPVPVRVVEPPASPWEVIKDVAGPLLAPIGTAGLVIVFVVLILLEREDLRDRLIRLVGGTHLPITTQAFDEAATRVSRYLLMQLVINATYGLPIGVGLYLIGVPNALLWGVLATILRFIPFLGPVIAALFPVALAFAVDPGWSMVIWTVALFAGLELVTGNIVEPWLFGSSTGISTVALILAVIFWTTLWGPVGLFLSIPLTVCLVVMGRYVPQVQFLSVLLGSEPVLTPAEHLYQRMLAGDADEGEEIADDILKTSSLTAFYDDVVIPALRLAERDRHRQVLAGERFAVATDTFLSVIGELADREDPAADVEAAQSAAAVSLPMAVDGAAVGKPVLCIAGRTALDRVASAMLAQLLERRGIGARILPADAISAERISSVEAPGTQVICLSYLSASAVAHARPACRRVRRRAPGVKIMVGLWNAQIDEGKGRDQVSGLSADLLATSLAQAVERIGGQVAAAIEAPLATPSKVAEIPELLPVPS